MRGRRVIAIAVAAFLALPSGACAALAAGNEAIVWQHVIGDKEKSDSADGISIAPDGSVYVIGICNLTKDIKDKSTLQAWLLKFSDQGELIWEKKFGKSPAGGDSVAATRDGGALITFFEKKDNRTSNNISIRRLDASGNLVWEQWFEGKRSSDSEVMETADGGAVAVSTTYGKVDRSRPGEWKTQIWAVRLDRAGRVLWEYLDPKAGHAHGAALAADGGVFITGRRFAWRDGNKHTLSLIAKLDDRGAPAWSRGLGDTGYSWGEGIAASPDGGFFVAAYTLVKRGGNRYARDDFWVLRFDAQGMPLWDRKLGGPNNDTVRDIVLARDGGVLVAGRKVKTDGWQRRVSAWVVKLSAGGELIGGRFFDSGSSGANDIALAADGRAVIAGYQILKTNTREQTVLGSYTPKQHDLWIAKTNLQ